MVTFQSDASVHANGTRNVVIYLISSYGDWELHLNALETLIKYIFAHDRLNYACTIPLYLAEIKSIKESDDSIFDESLQGN